MRFHNHSSLLAMTLTLALTTLAHPIFPTSDDATPAAHDQQPLQDYEVQLLVVQELGTQRLVRGRPEPGTLGWRAEKWAEIVRWWKGEVGGVAEEEEEEDEEVECGEVDGEDEDGIEEEDEERQDEEDGQVEL